MFAVNTKEILLLSDKELSASKEKYESIFHNQHEAWAVLKEEIEESEEDMYDLKVSHDACWSAIRNDNNVLIKNHIRSIKDSAIKCIQELLQVIAMCDKWEESNEKNIN